MNLLDAAANVRDKTVHGHLADLRRMPREVIDSAPNATLYRYLPTADTPPVDLPVLLVPPLGAPDFAYDLRRGCSMVELLTGSPEVRFETALGGHLGVLTGRRSRDTTWTYLDVFLDSHDPSR